MATVRTAAEIRKELEAAEQRERDETRARKWATPPQFEYWIVPAKLRATTSFGKLYDPTCLLYELKRTISNRTEARSAGWADDDLREGSATYLYNVVTRRIVCAVGGGTVYVGRSMGMEQEDFADDTAFFHIGNYLAEYPGGGEITYIVEAYKAARKESASNGHKS